jgi:hypothetical protein
MEFKPSALSARRLFLATFIAVSYPMAAVATDLSAYPSAKTQPLPAGVHSVVSRCGHTFTMEKSMTVDTDPSAVAKWYQSRLPGSRTIDLSRALSDEEGGGSNHTTTIQVFTADGSQTVVVTRMHFDAALAKASATLGMDKTDIGIEGISPPLAPGYIALTAQAAAGGASGRKAKQQMEAACR